MSEPTQLPRFTCPECGHDQADHTASPDLRCFGDCGCERYR